MKPTFKLLGVLVLLLATLIPQGLASAGVSRFQEHRADAYFYSYDDSGCIQTSVIMEMAEDVLLSIQLLRYDLCNNVTLLEAFGSKDLSKSEFDYRGNLDSAALTTTVQVYDYVTDSTFDVSIDLTWAGTGDITRTQHHSTDSPSPGCSANLLIQEKSRSADAWGTISDGTTNFTSESASQANLYFAQRTLTTHGCD